MTPDEARAAVAAHIAALPGAVYRPLDSVVSAPAWEQLGPVRADLARLSARLLVAVVNLPRPARHPRYGVAVTRLVPASLPAIPELLDGADSAARRTSIDHIAPLLRELAAAIETAPPDVAAKARAAVAKLIGANR